MEVEGGVAQSIIDEFHSADIQGYQMEGESAVIGRIIDELQSSYIRGD